MAEAISDYISETLCCNCNCITVEGMKNTLLISVDGELVDEIVVCDALAYIYGLSSEEIQSISTSYLKGSSNFNSQQNITSKCHKICQSCSHLLSENYKAHKLYENSIQPLSFVEGIKRFITEGCPIGSQSVAFQKRVTDNSTQDPLAYYEEAGFSEDLLQEFCFEDESGEVGYISTSETKFEPLEALKDIKAEREEKTNVYPLDKVLILQIKKLSEDDLRKYGIKSKNRFSSHKKFVQRVKKKHSITNKIGGLGNKKSKSSQFRLLQQKQSKNLGPWTCEICGDVIMHFYQYKYSHVPSHFKNKVVRCQICGQPLTTSFNFTVHMKLSHGFKEQNKVWEIPCNICGTMIYCGSRKSHIKEAHPNDFKEEDFDEDTFIPSEIIDTHCKICDKILQNETFLERHLRNRHFTEAQKKAWEVTCKFCGEIVYAGTLKSHVMEKHPDNFNEETFKVPKIIIKTHNVRSKKTVAPSPVNSKKSIQSVFSDLFVKIQNSPVTLPKAQVQCQICGKMFSGKKTLGTHTRKIHVDEGVRDSRKMKCAICDQDVFSYYLKAHMQKHSETRVSFPCEQCGRVFKRKHSHRHHLETHKDGFVPFNCNICGSKMNNKNSFGSHMKFHREGKTLSCDICQKKFFTQGEVNDHRKTHSTEKTCICPECGEVYKSNRTLKQHLKGHADVAKYGGNGIKCDECGVRLKHDDSLARHKIRRHANPKRPYRPLSAAVEMGINIPTQ